MKNGGKNKSVAFIILFSINYINIQIYIQIFIKYCMCVCLYIHYKHTQYKHIV